MGSIIDFNTNFEPIEVWLSDLLTPVRVKSDKGIQIICLKTHDCTIRLITHHFVEGMKYSHRSRSISHSICILSFGTKDHIPKVLNDTVHHLPGMF